jgi:hypothetical protein
VGFDATLPSSIPILLVALVVVDTGYSFAGVFRLIHGVPFHSRLFRYLADLGAFRFVPLPLPLAYIKGMDLQCILLDGTFWYFMLGRWSQRGWMSYYAVAFLLKSQIPLLLLLAVAMVSLPKTARKQLQLVLIVPMLVIFLFFSLTRMSRGLRYILPIYLLLFVWLSETIDSRSGWGISRFRTALLLLGLWYAGGFLLIAPHYLAYFNELCGGPSNGYILLNESNFDWGQELKRLSGYLHQRGIKRIQLGYFGTADPGHYGITYDPLPRDREKALQIGGLVAVSATLLNNDYYSWLRQMEPIDKIGYTIFIYKVS